ncbi:MAG: 4Fe-4S binding protein [Nitrososphaerota archaeon]
MIEDNCNGCTLCMQVCPYDAIIVEKIKER